MLFGEEGKIITRISQSPRGAIFRLRQAIYSIIKGKGLDLEASKSNWQRAAEQIINALKDETRPCRIELTYLLEKTDKGLALKPLKFKVEVFQKVRDLEGALDS